MTTLETVTVIISSVAIGASVASVLTFLVFGMLQRRLILRDKDETKVSDETVSVMGLLGDAFKDDVLDSNREVLKAVVERYSQTSLTSVLSDDTERFYLFEALADPSRVPWESEEQQRGGRAK
jgi:hypothetical protein